MSISSYFRSDIRILPSADTLHIIKFKLRLLGGYTLCRAYWQFVYARYNNVISVTTSAPEIVTPGWFLLSESFLLITGRFFELPFVSLVREQLWWSPTPHTNRARFTLRLVCIIILYSTCILHGIFYKNVQNQGYIHAENIRGKHFQNQKCSKTKTLKYRNRIKWEHSVTLVMLVINILFIVSYASIWIPVDIVLVLYIL